MQVRAATMPSGETVLAVTGELDIFAAPVLKGAIAGASERVVLDLREMAFIDSAGVHALVEQRERAMQRGGWLRLVYRADQQVGRVLALLGLAELLPGYADPQAALRG